MRKKTTKEFIEEADKVHNYKYDYSKSIYTIAKEKLIITCPEHGDFLQTPDAHLRGSGCPKCKARKQSIECSLTTEEFVKRAKEVHGDKYNYSKVNYINSKTNVCIICPEHGEFLQLPLNHIYHGKGCPKCGRETLRKKLTLPQENFIERAHQIHGNKYDYSKTKYTGMYNPITVICPKHGEFEQKAIYHILGFGCRKCSNSMSVGEQLIEQALKEMNIKFKMQGRVRNKYHKEKCIVVDFYFKNNNKLFVIEYNGILHYKPVEKFGGVEVFNKQILRDKDLLQMCKENLNVNFISIPYSVRSINNIKLIIQQCIDADDGLAMVPIDFFYELLSAYSHENNIL